MDVAVVGLGAMGSRIARRLLGAGHRVVVWNRTSARAEALREDGAEVAATPAAAAEAGVVLTMLSGPDALREVAPELASARTVIEMSTLGPSAVAELRETLPEETELVDAPVLGSLSEVEAGTLQIFVGGSEDSFRRWSPLLAELGEPLHAGPLGAGAAAKLVANTTLFGTISVLGEALVLARALGLPKDVAFDVLAATPVATQAERRRAAVETGEYPPRFSLSLARKDADLVAEAAAASGASLPVQDVARARLRDAEDAGWGDRDYSALLAWMLGSD